MASTTRVGHTEWADDGTRASNEPVRGHSHYFPAVVNGEDSQIGMEFREALDGGVANVILCWSDVIDVTDDQVEQMITDLTEAPRQVREFRASRT